MSMSGHLISLLAQYHPEDGWIGTWSPGIGDPTFVGWLTVAAYLAAAFLCFRVYRRMPAPVGRRAPGSARVLAPLLGALASSRREIAALPGDVRLRALWLGLAVTLFLLGLNKQLDLQTVLTEIGRIMARSEGWYAGRRRVQAAFILGVLLVGAWIFRTVVLLARGNLRRMRSVLIGAVFLVCFVTIRAASFHHIDRFIGEDVGGFKLNWILELGGLAFVIHGAWSNLGRVPAR
jgi:hypothetical protein